MKYLDSINQELKDYLLILCDNNYPEFIEKYICTKELQRLSRIGQFCGVDYTKIFDIRFWYSRLDHSVACSLMTWKFTGDKTQTLSALFHDLGTPAFSHTVDFLMGDPVNQESSELNVMDIISSSDELVELLKGDGITDINLLDNKNYPIVENDKPRICVDRLDGIFGTCLIWTKYWDLNKIKSVYQNMDVLVNEDNLPEIGFTDKLVCEEFFDGVFKYSMELQKNEDKFILKFLATILEKVISNGLIKIDDLYIMSEDDVLNIIESMNEPSWDVFKNSTNISRSDDEIKDNFLVSISSKKRYVVPLFLNNETANRLNDFSDTCKTLLEEYLSFNDSKYCYIEGINF